VRIRIRETTILVNRRGIGPVPAIARIPSAIDEPGPLRGGFDDQTLDVRMIRGSLLHDRGEIVRQPFVGDPLILLIE